MDWARKIEDYFLTPKVSAHNALEILAKAVSQTNREIELSSSSALKYASAHLVTAERLYDSALLHFQNGEYSLCQKCVEQSSTYLQLATCLANGANNQELLASAQDFVFPVNSAEYIINELLESIAHTKLAVESGNFHVSHKVKDLLIRVVKLARRALSDLRGDEREDAEFNAQAALYLLSWALRLLANDNKQAALKNEFSGHLNRGADDYDASMRNFIGRLAMFYNSLATAGVVNSKKIGKHLEEAEERLEDCISAIIDGQIDSLDSLITAGMIEVVLCEQLLINVVPPQTGNLTSLEPGEPEVDSSFQSDEAFHRFYKSVEQIIRLGRELSVRDSKRFESKIYSSMTQFRDAAYHFKYGNCSEAQRLAWGAYYDWDFGRQIALTDDKPYYRELEI